MEPVRAVLRQRCYALFWALLRNYKVHLNPPIAQVVDSSLRSPADTGDLGLRTLYHELLRVVQQPTSTVPSLRGKGSGICQAIGSAAALAAARPWAFRALVRLVKPCRLDIAALLIGRGVIIEDNPGDLLRSTWQKWANLDNAKGSAIHLRMAQ